jgi:hypothetical protein
VADLTAAFPRSLTERERETLEFILSGDFRGAAALRIQAQSAKVTGSCKCGCATIDLEVDRNSSPRADLASYQPVAAEGRFDGIDSCGLLLFTDDGWLSGLEIWYVADEPPREFPPPEMFEPPYPPRH